MPEDTNKIFGFERSQIPLIGLMLTMFMIIVDMFGWLRLDMNAMRAELRADNNALRTELRADISALRTELKRKHGFEDAPLDVCDVGIIRLALGGDVCPGFHVQ